jgi:hypothetical protein
VEQKGRYDDLSDEEMEARVVEIFTFLKAHENESHTRIGWAMQEVAWELRKVNPLVALVGLVILAAVARACAIPG